MPLLTGRRVQSSGSVEVLGGVPYENEGVLSRVCFVKEGQRYPDHCRVRDALHAAGLVHPDWDADLADDLLRDFDLPVKRPVKKLSRGMTSVVGLASRAPVTLFDEPYLGLDAVTRQLSYDRLLADHAEHPRTVVLSTPLIEEIAPLLERVLLLDCGRILLDADADSLRDSAVTVTGPSDRVATFARQHELLHSESLAGQSRSVVRLSAGSDGGDAADAGLSWEPTMLQQLVVAMSLRTTVVTPPPVPSSRRSRGEPRPGRGPAAPGAPAGRSGRALDGRRRQLRHQLGRLADRRHPLPLRGRRLHRRGLRPLHHRAHRPRPGGDAAAAVRDGHQPQPAQLLPRHLPGRRRHVTRLRRRPRRAGRRRVGDGRVRRRPAALDAATVGRRRLPPPGRGLRCTDAGPRHGGRGHGRGEQAWGPNGVWGPAIGGIVVVGGVAVLITWMRARLDLGRWLADQSLMTLSVGLPLALAALLGALPFAGIRRVVP